MARLFLALLLLAASPAWANFFLGGGHGSGPPSPSTQSVAANGITLDGSPTTDSFVCGSGDETTVSVIAVALSPASPLFAGTLSLSGADAQFFELDSPTLPANLLTVGAPPCRTNNITLTATAAAGQPLANGPYTQSFTITAVQQAIAAITLSGTSFTSGAASGTTVGTLGVTLSPAPPPNPMGTVYALASGISGCTGTDNASFTVGSDGVSLQTVGTLSGASYAVCVSATNPLFTTSTCSVLSGSTCYMPFTITTAGQIIVSTSISKRSFTAGGTSGTTVGTLSTTMGPPSPAFAGTYSLVSSGGSCSGGDTTHFVISGSNVNLTSTATSATTYTICVATAQSGLTTINTAFTLTGASSSLPVVCTAGQPCVANTRIYNSSTCTTGGTVTTLGLSSCPGVWTNNNYTQPATIGVFNLFQNQPIRAAELYSVEPGDTVDAWPATYDEGDIPMILTHTIACIGTYPSLLGGPGACILNPAASFSDGNNATQLTAPSLISSGATSLPFTYSQYSSIYAGGCTTVANGGNAVSGTGIASPTYVAPSSTSATTLPLSAATTTNIPMGTVISITNGCAGKVTFGGFRNGPHGGMNPTVTYTGWQIQDVTNVGIPYVLNFAYTTTADTPPSSTSIQFSAAALTAGNGRNNGTLTGYQFALGGNTFVGQSAIPSGCAIPSGGVNYSTGVVSLSCSTTADIPSGTAITIVAAHGDGQCMGQMGMIEGHPTQCGGDAVGGIRMQGGNVTCNNCASFHDTNFILGNPWVFEQGVEKCNNCFIQYNGGGQGQSHAWYCGEVQECDVSGSTILDTNNGEGFKTRGQVANVANSLIGDSDACPASANVANTWVPRTDGTGGWPGGNSNLGMANQINGTQGGTFTLTNNTFCKSGTYSTNVSTLELAAGQVLPSATTSWTETGSNYYSTCPAGRCSNYMWPGLLANGSTTSMSISTLAIHAPISGDVPNTCILSQYGSCSGTVSINGGSATTWTPAVSCLYEVMIQEGCTLTTYDYRTSTSNVSLTSTTFPNTVTVLGPNNVTCPACTISITANSNNTALTGGPGGSTINSTTNWGFHDQAGYSPSTLTTALGGATTLNADGDTLNVQKTTSDQDYVMVSGRNETINMCAGTASLAAPCGGQAMFVSSQGYLPSGSIVGNYTTFPGGGAVLCLSGCNISVTGNWSASMQFYGNPATTAGNAEVLFNATTTTVSSQFAYQGCSMNLGGTGGGSGQITDWSNNSCRDFFYITKLPAGLGTIHNTTLDFGPSTDQSIPGESANSLGAQFFPALVVGSGRATATLNPATDALFPGTSYTLIQVLPTSMTGITGAYGAPLMPQHNSGGMLTITNYTASQAPYAPVIALGGMSISCSGTTVSATDGIAADNVTLVLQNLPSCGTLNTTPPSGSQDGNLTPPSSPSGTHGTTISIPVTLSDAWWQNLNGTLDQGPGEGFAQACANGGTLIFNGSSSPIAGGTTLPSSFCPVGYTGITMASTPAAMVSALAALHYTLGPAGSYTVQVATWNGAGQRLFTSFTVVSH